MLNTKVRWIEVCVGVSIFEVGEDDQGVYAKAQITLDETSESVDVMLRISGVKPIPLREWRRFLVCDQMAIKRNVTIIASITEPKDPCIAIGAVELLPGIVLEAHRLPDN